MVTAKTKGNPVGTPLIYLGSIQKGKRKKKSKAFALVAACLVQKLSPVVVYVDPEVRFSIAVSELSCFLERFAVLPQWSARPCECVNWIQSYYPILTLRCLYLHHPPQAEALFDYNPQCRNQTKHKGSGEALPLCILEENSFLTFPFSTFPLVGIHVAAPSLSAAGLHWRRPQRNQKPGHDSTTILGNYLATTKPVRLFSHQLYRQACELGGRACIQAGALFLRPSTYVFRKSIL